MLAALSQLVMCAVLELAGVGSVIEMNQARISASCEASSPAVEWIEPHRAAFVWDGSALNVTAWLSGVALECQHIQTPCVSSNPSFPALFHCEWVGAGGAHVVGPLSASRTQVTATGEVSLPYLVCPLPADLPSLLAATGGVSGPADLSLTLNVKHLVPRSADATVSSDATAFLWNGVWEGNVVNVSLLAPPPPAVPPVPPPPAVPPVPPSVPSPPLSPPPSTPQFLTSFTDVGNTTWVAPFSATIRVLVVAGGGQGGSRTAGGGGGGGVVVHPAFEVVGGRSYTVVVGAGGWADGGPGGNGGDSQFGSLIALGGGGGGSDGDADGSEGGSGGGGRYGTSGSAGLQPSQPGDSGAYGYGNAGGYGTGVGSYNGGGGGGAGGQGEDAFSDARGCGDGGPGIVSDITGESLKYGAGGGGGSHAPHPAGCPGSGGSGGVGGDGSLPAQHAGTGMANRGGGGGGSSQEDGGTISQKGGAGGSGIVVIRAE